MTSPQNPNKHAQFNSTYIIMQFTSVIGCLLVASVRAGVKTAIDGNCNVGKQGMLDNDLLPINDEMVGGYDDS